MLKFPFLFMVIGFLFLASCNAPTPSQPNTLTIQDSLPPTPEGLTLGENQVAVRVHLDDGLYVQLLDTIQINNTPIERANSPVYECACKIAGSCKINSTGPRSIACVPTASSCSSEVQFPTDKGHPCAFKKVAAYTALYTALNRSYLESYGWLRNRDTSFNENGMRNLNYYTLQFEAPLKALYSLANGQQIASYFPRNKATPILVTCSCDCPSGADCRMMVSSSNELSCRPQSSCLPQPDGHPCDGCKFATAAMSLEELEEQAVSKQFLQE